ncbi:MAG: DUF4252 domain-containing protein [Candidatus Hydrogenedentota bacterium]
MNRTLAQAGFAATIFCAAALAQTDYKSMPGYIDFNAADVFGAAEPMVEIMIEKPMLDMMTAAMKGADKDGAEIAKLTEGLQLVRVHVYQIKPEESQTVKDKLDALVKALNGQGWATGMSMRSNENPDRPERVSVLMKTAGDKMSGMAVVVSGGTDAVFVNVVGELDPAAIGTLLSSGFMGDMDLDFDEFAHNFPGAKTDGHSDDDHDDGEKDGDTDEDKEEKTNN